MLAARVRMQINEFPNPDFQEPLSCHYVNLNSQRILARTQPAPPAHVLIRWSSKLSTCLMDGWCSFLPSSPCSYKLFPSLTLAVPSFLCPHMSPLTAQCQLPSPNVCLEFPATWNLCIATPAMLKHRIVRLQKYPRVKYQRAFGLGPENGNKSNVYFKTFFEDISY